MALAAACSDPTGGLLDGRLEVEPSGSAAQCQVVEVRFVATSHARYSVSHGSTVLGLGTTHGGPVRLSFDSGLLDPTARNLDVTLVGARGRTGRDAAALHLEPGNRAPLARPRLRTAPSPGARVALDASASEDPDGDPLTYQWTLTEPSRGAAITGDGPSAELALPEGPATVVVELVVRDPAGAFDRRTLAVRSVGPAGNSPPVLSFPDGFHHVRADPGADTSLRPSVTDPDGDPVTLSFTQLAGPRLALETDGEELRFTAPQVEAMVAIGVEATDGVDTVRARYVVTTGEAAANEPPVAVASLASPARLLHTVTASAAGSADPDSTELVYRWSFRSTPPGSLLGCEQLEPGAQDVRFVPDVPGEYELRLRVEDSVGPAPQDAVVAFTASLAARRITDGDARDMVCLGSGVAWVGRAGVGVAPRAGSPIRREDLRAGALAGDGRGNLWIPTDPGAGPTLQRVDAETLEVDGTVALPDGAGEVLALVADPAPSRLGDLYVGTTTGTAILDVSQSSCGEPLGCWVGSPSTGYLHRPPSKAGFASEEVHRMSVALDQDGATVVHIGNQHWVVRLDRRGEEYDFSQSVIDLFADGLPRAVTALSPGVGTLYVGVEGLGLVRRESERDCGYRSPAPVLCERVGPEGCAGPPTNEPPAAVHSIALSDDFIFVAAEEGFYALLPDESRMLRLLLEGVPGVPARVAVCGQVPFLGTSDGVWALELSLDGD